MAAELPDLDQPLSFVVDDGEAVGPMALDDIVDSMSTGARQTDAYVWWIGASEWVPFNSDDRLMALLAEADVPDTAGEASEEVTEDDIDLVAAEALAGSDDEELNDEESTDVDIDLVQPFSFAVETPQEDADPGEILTESGSVLANVGARLDALAMATRSFQESSEVARGASHVAKPATMDPSGSLDLREDEEPRTLEAMPDPVVIEPAIESSAVQTSTHETTFDVLVRHTTHHERLNEQSERVRELLARACGAAISRQGYSVTRRTELHGHYFFGFESGADTRRINLEITPAKSVSGDTAHHIHFAMSWGRMAFDIDEALTVVQDQLPVADRRLGSISSDAELDTGSVSTRVDLILPLDDYVGNDYSIDRERLESSLGAIQHALETRWYELFIPAE